MLGLHYASLRRIRDMLAVLTPIADSLEPGFYNDLYLSVFERFEKTPHLRNAPLRARIEFYNTYGLLLSRNSRQSDALAAFKTLRVLSKRGHNAWGEGRSYINAGVAAAYSGDSRAATSWYRKAVAFGRRHRDPWLVARALGNLATFEDPATAASLLDESEKIKRRIGDVVGLAGTLVTRGNLAAATGDYVVAARSYREAASLARRLDLRYVRTLALRNLARTEVDRGRPTRAFALYRKAQAIAEAERFRDQLRDAVAGEALAHIEAKQFRRAEVLFERLVELDRARGDYVQAIVSLNDIGVMRMYHRRIGAAFRALATAAERARDREFGIDAHMALGDYLWAKRTLNDRAKAYQAYVAGMLLALPLPLETMLSVGSHAASNKLHTLFREEDRMETLAEIERQTTCWLERQLKRESERDRTRVIMFALWPIRVARRVLSRSDFGYNLTGKAMGEILREEIPRGLGSARSEETVKK